MALSAPSASAAPVRDGSSSFAAAASCWEIKQEDGSASSGLYWLQTPLLVAPEQFYCDMSTDGGGWVLVGRGREGWRQEYEGLRPELVSQSVTGQSAFLAAQLPSRTIDGLLNGEDVSDLDDGIRLRRAKNTSGSSWQEARFEVPKMTRWVWTFGSEQPVGSFRFDSTTGSGGKTSSFGKDGSYNRVDWGARSSQGWNMGWAYGANLTGSSSSSSYLWSATSSTGYAFGFTQVWLRPKVLSGDVSYPAVPNGGSAKQELPALHSTLALAESWGVTGLADGVDGEFHAEVSALAQIGNRVYVGGNFEYAQRGQSASGSDKVRQPFLAAFNVNTGAFDPGFRPVLNGRVHALAGLPDGTLVAGGFFSRADGASVGPLVALDPVTGASRPGWSPLVENRVTGGIASVREVQSAGGYLYAAGSFTHVGGAYARGAVRLAAADGAVDAGWTPQFDGTVLDLHVSPRGDRGYFAGYFSTSDGVPAARAAVISTAPGAAVVPFTFVGSAAPDSGRTNYQMTVKESGDRVYFAGAEHAIFGYDRSSMQRTSSAITRQGGDFQASTTWQGLVYAGCHCGDYNYTDADSWPSVGTKWTLADKIGHVGAWDGATGEYLPDFNPVIKGRRGYGPWATMVDSTGKLWVGGDFATAVTPVGNRWVGGYVRFPARDTTAPGRPSGLGAALSGSSLALSWSGVSGADHYEVIKDDRVITTSTSASASVPVPTTDSRYFVRAVDATGNRSASTLVRLAGPSYPILPPLPPRDAGVPLAPDEVLEVQAAGGSTGVPFDAEAVSLNVTVTEAKGNGFLTVYPCGANQPGTSNVNYTAGQTIANAVVAAVGEFGRVCFAASSTVHVVVDYGGYFPSSSPLVPMEPQRLLDSRRTPGKPGAGSDTEVQLPVGSAAGAVVVTVTQPATPGWVSAYPCGTDWPGTSTVNFAAGQTIAGGAIVGAGTDRKICVRASTMTHLVIDLMATIDSSGDFTATTPTRQKDTRRDEGTRLQPGVELVVPTDPVAPSVVLNLTSTGSTARGWLQAYPCNTDPAVTSNLNYTAGQTIANAAIVKTGGGNVCVRTSAPTHVIVDQNAVMPTSYQPAAPSRLEDTRR